MHASAGALTDGDACKVIEYTLLRAVDDIDSRRCSAGRAGGTGALLDDDLTTVLDVGAWAGPRCS